MSDLVKSDSQPPVTTKRKHQRDQKLKTKSLEASKFDVDLGCVIN